MRCPRGRSQERVLLGGLLLKLFLHLPAFSDVPYDTQEHPFAAVFYRPHVDLHGQKSTVFFYMRGVKDTMPLLRDLQKPLRDLL